MQTNLQSNNVQSAREGKNMVKISDTILTLFCIK